MVLSRIPPPAEYTQLRVTQRLEVLGWKELRLDPQEPRASQN